MHDIASDRARDLFASHRMPAWHGLGTVFDHPVTDWREMLDLSGLAGWNVHDEPLTVAGVTDWAVGARAIVANIGGNPRVLGVTGDRYTVVQNEAAFSFLQSLQDGAHWETAGALKNGRVVFGSMAFSRDFTLDPSGANDKVESYLLVRTSHDGSSNVGGGVTPVRVVCANTLAVGLGKVSQTFAIRHTSSADERMRAEAELWRAAHTYMDAFEAEAQALYAKSVTDAQFFAMVDGLFPRPKVDAKGSLSKWESRRGLFAQAWNGAPNATVKGTAWGAFNALTEANQWGRSIRKGERGQESFYAAGAGFDGPTNAFRNAALAVVKAA